MGLAEDLQTTKQKIKPFFIEHIEPDEFQIKFWLYDNWTLPIWFAVIYVVLIFGIQRLMKNRQAFQLRPLMVLWSGNLAIFSTLGAIRSVSEMMHILSNYGLEFSFCDSSFMATGSPTELWVILFILSKPVELGDTLFIVLKKQKLIFLHWYHHISAMMIAWFLLASSARWVVTMNYTVHAIMYTYYTLKAMKFILPKWISMIITTLQIMQMMAALVINYMAYSALNRGSLCDLTYTNIMILASAYLSYFILFSHFFYTSYIAKKKTDVKTDGKKIK